MPLFSIKFGTNYFLWHGMIQESIKKLGAADCKTYGRGTSAFVLAEGDQP